MPNEPDEDSEIGDFFAELDTLVEAIRPVQDLLADEKPNVPNVKKNEEDAFVKASRDVQQLCIGVERHSRRKLNDLLEKLSRFGVMRLDCDRQRTEQLKKAQNLGHTDWLRETERIQNWYTSQISEINKMEIKAMASAVLISGKKLNEYFEVVLKKLQQELG